MTLTLTSAAALRSSVAIERQGVSPEARSGGGDSPRTEFILCFVLLFSSCFFIHSLYSIWYLVEHSMHDCTSSSGMTWFTITVVDKRIPIADVL